MGADSSNDPYYDLFEDYDLVESSFAQQYGIRLRYEDQMTWGEFSSLLSGIGPETPLGRIVAIRAETDEDRIKSFTRDERRIYDEWQNRKIKNATKDDYLRGAMELQKLFEGLG